MVWDGDESQLPDVISGTSLLEEAEAFLGHLSPSSSFGFVAGGGLAASGSPNRIRGTLADTWSKLLEWNEASGVRGGEKPIQ